MQLCRLEVERYKPYKERARLDVRPLTILIGRSNVGKTALARVIPLLAASFDPAVDGPALPLRASGLMHGATSLDLASDRVSGTTVSIAASWVHDQQDLRLEVNIQALGGDLDGQVILGWRLHRGEQAAELIRRNTGAFASYELSLEGRPPEPVNPIKWAGLIPEWNNRPIWVGETLEAIQRWATGIRYLRAPRRIDRWTTSTLDPSTHGAMDTDGQLAVSWLTSSSSCCEAASHWYQSTFGVRLDVTRRGDDKTVEVRSPGCATPLSLGQTGQGLVQVLPVVVMALTSPTRGPGCDVIEHPEADLHPAEHAHIAELLLAAPTRQRPLVVETHSELLLLRARRWIAEGRLAADDVAIHWIEDAGGATAMVRRIPLTEEGNAAEWPIGAFHDTYEEVLAIRRAARDRKRRSP